MSTFREFVTECENYEYSQEYFNMMKECSEVTLLGKYLENQRLISEYNSYANTFTVSEGYFAEAVDTNTVEVITEKFASGVRGLLGKIYNGILKIINAFINFLAKKKKAITKSMREDRFTRLKKKLFTTKQIVQMEDTWEAAKPKVLKFLAIAGGVAGAGGAAVVGARAVINANKQKIIDRLNVAEGDTIPEKAMNAANEIGNSLKTTAFPIIDNVKATLNLASGAVELPLIPSSAKAGIKALGGIVGTIEKLLGTSPDKANYLDAVTYITQATNTWKNNKTFDGSLTDEEKAQMETMLKQHRDTLQKIQSELEVKKNDVWSPSNETDTKQLQAATQAIRYANQLIATLMGTMAEYDQIVNAAVAAVDAAEKDVKSAEDEAKNASDAAKKAEAHAKQVAKNPNAKAKTKAKAQKAADAAKSAVSAANDKVKASKDDLDTKKKAKAEAEKERAAAQAKFDAGENPEDYKRN